MKSGARLRRLVQGFIVILAVLCSQSLLAKTADGHTRIVLIAGTRAPRKAGGEEYLKTVRLLKVMFDRAGLKGVQTVVVYDGWPSDPSVLDTADTIVFVSDGMQWSPWSFSPERIASMQKQIDRGCGFMLFHFATYIPYKFQKQALAWDGGYVEYDGPKYPHEYFTQKTLTSDVVFPTPHHPVLNGVKPFRVMDEFYYRATFVREGITPLLRVPELPADPKVYPGPLADPKDQVTMWAYDRPQANGRSIGATFGHYYDAWQNDDYRKLILNAIAWTAHVQIPPQGIRSTWVDDTEVDRLLGPTPAPVPSPLEPAR
jgi:type 1 glutamine amidotransferase